MKRTLFFFSLLVLISCKEDDYEIYPSPGRQIKSFALEEGQYGEAMIRSRENDYSVTVDVSPNADLTSIVPNIGISDEATIDPPSSEPLDITQQREYTYTVTAASGQQREWKIIFNVIDNSIADYGVYLITNAANDAALDVQGDITWNEKYWDNAKIGVSAMDNEADKWQKWHVIYNSTEDGVKFYEIRNLFSGKFLAVPNGNMDQQGTQLEQLGYSPDGENLDQKLWLITESDSGFSITNKASGMLLTSTTSDDTLNAVQQSKNNTEAQSWLLTAQEPDSYRDDKVINFFQRNDNDMGSVAFDQGNSIPLSWGPNAGKILWITEDSWDGVSLTENDKFNCGAFFSYNNSILIQPSKDDWDPEHTVNMTNPDNPEKPRQIAPNQPGTNRTWPGAGVEVGNKVYTSTAEGNGLENLGTVLYMLTENEGTAWEVERLTPSGADGSSGMVKGNDGYVYAYSSKSAFGYSSSIYVARFPEDDPMNWTFWNGSEWGSVPPELDAPGAVASALGSTGISKLNGKYIMMTMDNGYFCNDDRGSVYLSTSDSPTGPFSEKTKVYQITEYLHGQYARYYTPIVHPYFDNGQQELLLTYSINFGACEQESCDADGTLNPYYYRLKSIRVPYEIIGI